MRKLNGTETQEDISAWIRESQEEMARQQLESAESTARYELVTQMLNMAVMNYSNAMTGLIYAGLNPNFCKPKT